ncbi:MAG TPA: flagellar biosynthesis anti-sigma factor FlgM [Acidobacteriaceae bacterium]
MKIELAGVAAMQPAIEQSSKHASSSSAVTSGAVAEDRATLSSDSQTVQSLVGQAMQTPAVRQDVVDAVRQTIRSGEYKVDAGKITEGILAESND